MSGFTTLWSQRTLPVPFSLDKNDAATRRRLLDALPAEALAPVDAREMDAAE
jgi:hypothetical protein